MRTFLASALSVLALVAGVPLGAQQTSQEKTNALLAVLAVPELLEIMRAEGLAYGDTLADEMFPGGANPIWEGMVLEIYDVQIMYEEVSAGFAEELDGADLDAMLDFFNSDLGQQIVSLEVSAREALLNEGVEEASKEAAALANADGNARFDLIEEFIAANQLIETNVVGALNSNYAFYMGLMDGGALPEGVTSETALQEVWAQEGMIRENTTEWLHAFLFLAYQPLSDAELQAYIAFSQSDAGHELNSAMFSAFDGAFNDISRALGLASSRILTTQDL